jgi:hypothetical protein
MPMGILERLAEGPVLGDGGYLLELEKRGYVQAGPFTPEVVVEHPEALVQLHREFLRAGAEVLQTMTFYASDDKLATVGMEGMVDDINRDAVRILARLHPKEMRWLPATSPSRGRTTRPTTPAPITSGGSSTSSSRGSSMRGRRTSGSERRSRTWERRCCSSNAPGRPVCR